MGSIFNVPVVRLGSRQRSWRGWPPGRAMLSAPTCRGGTISERWPIAGPTLLVMGGEGAGPVGGARRRVLAPGENSHGRPVDSLNLAVATALALYQIRGPHLRV